MVTAVIAWGKRPVPSRTRKLRPTAPMVLHPGGCGRVGHRRNTIHGRGPPTTLGVLPHLTPQKIFQARASKPALASVVRGVSTHRPHAGLDEELEMRKSLSAAAGALTLLAGLAVAGPAQAGDARDDNDTAKLSVLHG